MALDTFMTRSGNATKRKAISLEKIKTKMKGRTL